MDNMSYNTLITAAVLKSVSFPGTIPHWNETSTYLQNDKISKEGDIIDNSLMMEMSLLMFLDFAIDKK